MSYGSLIPVMIHYGEGDEIEPQRYAKGGLVVKAKQVRDAGRYGDTELVHVSRDELDDMRLRWGEPTINPETGMPEFFLGKFGKILGKIAKVAAPIAVSFIPGIGPLAAAGLGAVIGGGVGALDGGGWKGALSGAITGGLGAAGGSALGAGKVFAGAAAPALASNAANLGAGLAAPSANIAGLMGSAGLPGVAAAAPAAAAPIAGIGSGWTGALSSAASLGGSGTTLPTTVAKPNFWNRDFLGTGIKNKFAVPVLGLGATALASAFEPKQEDPLTAEQFYSPALGGKGFDPAAKTTASAAPTGTARTVNSRPMEDYKRAGYMPEYNYFSAEGGEVDPEEGSHWRPAGARVNAARGGSPFAVNGDGNGREDKIEARLSDGEYVMDAETVAMLGDGSTKAGAKALDDFRVKIRQHKGSKLAKGKISPKAKAPAAYLTGARG
jgi:hypothetical protein